MRFLSMLSAALLFVPGPSHAQQGQAGNSVSTIRAVADAVTTAPPDRAQIHIGVVTQGPTAEAASGLNAKTQAGVLAQIKKELGNAADIKTVSFSVVPSYRYPKDGNPIISGYTATNVLQVHIDDMSRVGKIIDIASQSGANQIQRLRFMLKDQQAPELAALREASVRAKAKVDAIASALGLKVIRILSVEEASEAVRPFQERTLALAEAAPRGAPTPIEPGDIEIRAQVTLLAEVAPK